MTDRLLLLALVVGAVLAGGVLARWWARRRQHAALANLRLGDTANGAPRIVSFYGPSCDACDRQKIVLAELEAERGGELAIEHHDATRDYDYARQFGLIIVPTTVVVRPDGSIAGINSGLASRQQLESQLAA